MRSGPSRGSAGAAAFSHDPLHGMVHFVEVPKLPTNPSCDDLNAEKSSWDSEVFNYFPEYLGLFAGRIVR